ncbi:MAG: 4Fe-4S dicluster domain-containing protein [Anaerolineae bacterium]
MPRWGMVIDLDKCTGCQACSMACRMENSTPFAGPEEADLSRVKWWHRVLRLEEGEYPHVKITFIPQPCQHCDNPPCVRVCPVGATFKDEEGLVQVDYDRCIGCRFCAQACPYSVRHFNWYAPKYPEEMGAAINPDVPPRPRGVIEKCTFCVHRLRRAKRKAAEEDRELRDAEMVNMPACNQVCPAFARYFGDLDDPGSTVSRLAASPRAFVLLEELGTHPKVIYLKQVS